MDSIHRSISLGVLSACSMLRTVTGSSPLFLLMARSCRSSTVGSVCTAAGSSRTLSPSPSSLPSGRGICTRWRSGRKEVTRAAAAPSWARLLGGPHLDHRVNLAHSGQVVRNEALELGAQLHVLRLVPRDVLEQVLHLLGHGQVLELGRVVGTGGGAGPGRRRGEQSAQGGGKVPRPRTGRRLPLRTTRPPPTRCRCRSPGCARRPRGRATPAPGCP